MVEGLEQDDPGLDSVLAIAEPRRVGRIRLQLLRELHQAVSAAGDEFPEPRDSGELVGLAECRLTAAEAGGVSLLRAAEVLPPGPHRAVRASRRGRELPWRPALT